MSGRTTIEWCDRVWNPIVGCSRVSEGCRNCYAERMAGRIASAADARERKGETCTPTQRAYQEVVRRRDGIALQQWSGKAVLIEAELDAPLRVKQPQRWFTASMGDVFHESVDHESLCLVFRRMREASWHTFLVLTKRPERAYVWQCFMSATDGVLPNVWLGTSVEDQKTAAARIPDLIDAPASMRFLSCEPLLGPLDLSYYLRTLRINQVIVGGESGHGARRMDPRWVRDLRDQCQAHRVAFFFKQWGAFDEYGRRVGKKAAGAVLDGREWREMPA